MTIRRAIASALLIAGLFLLLTAQGTTLTPLRDLTAASTVTDSDLLYIAQSSGTAHRKVTFGTFWRAATASALGVIQLAGDLAGTAASPQIAATAVGAAELASDAVTEPKLKAVNSPTDEYCLEYESTTGDFEWEACSAGEAYRDDWDPRRPPTTCAACEEFTNGAESLTWRNGNIGSCSQTLAKDSSIISCPTDAAVQFRGRWTTPPSGSWTATMFFAPRWQNSANSAGQLMALLAGTEGSPTNMKAIYNTNGGNIQGHTHSTSYAPDANAGTLAGPLVTDGRETFLQAIYDATADTLLFRYSHDCWGWMDIYNVTGVTSDPVSVGYFVRNYNATAASEMRTIFFRIRTDANRNECSD